MKKSLLGRAFLEKASPKQPYRNQIYQVCRPIFAVFAIVKLEALLAGEHWCKNEQ